MGWSGCVADVLQVGLGSAGLALMGRAKLIDWAYMPSGTDVQGGLAPLETSTSRQDEGATRRGETDVWLQEPGAPTWSMKRLPGPLRARRWLWHSVLRPSPASCLLPPPLHSPTLDRHVVKTAPVGSVPVPFEYQACRTGYCILRGCLDSRAVHDATVDKHQRERVVWPQGQA